jgi:hypothetical protein
MRRVTDEITIEIYPEIRVIPIVPQSTCNTGAATYNFDLTKTLQLYWQKQSGIESSWKSIRPPSTTNITYHLNKRTKGEAAISSLHTIMSSESGKVIYAKFKHNFTLLRNTLFWLLIVCPNDCKRTKWYCSLRYKTRDETPKLLLILRHP